MDEDATRILSIDGDAVSEEQLETRVHCLELEDEDAPRRIVVSESGVLIGRVAPADLVLADSEVSRRHCQVRLGAGGLTVVDLGSTNGTFVDGERISGAAPLPVGSAVRIGRFRLRHEWRTQREIRQSEELDRDLARASSYVSALLPAPSDAGPIRSEWIYLPSVQLGGDGFGYGRLPDGRFAVYLIDVSGHGAGAAMHTVSILGALRRGAVPGADLGDPGSVLTALNRLFPMDDHAGMYFTAWYGVFDPQSRSLAYASGGHHPAFLRPATGEDPTPLRTRGPLIGAIPDKTYESQSVTVPAGARLYVFSDGVFEIVTNAGVQWGLQDFLPLLAAAPISGVPECDRLLRAVSEAARPGGFEDDFSLVVLGLD